MENKEAGTTENIRSSRKKRPSVLKRVLIGIAIAVLVLFVIPMVFSAYSTAPFAYVVQTADILKSGTVTCVGEADVCDRDIYGIAYGNTYPSGTFDILYANKSDAPTFLFVHGGGDLTGSSSDPDIVPFLETVRSAGFHVVSLNYALMPDGPFPVPIRQIAEALLFLRAHGPEYGLDTERLIMMGQSSGAAIVAQYAAAVSDPVYADSLGLSVEAVYPRPSGVILDDAPLDTEHMSWGMKLVICNYIAGRTVLTGEEAALYDAARHFTSNAPPCFIIGSYAYRKDAVRISEAVHTAGSEAELFDPYALYRKRKGHCFINSAEKDDISAEAISRLLSFASQRAEIPS